jgi:hypothetical protein
MSVASQIALIMATKQQRDSKKDPEKLLALVQEYEQLLLDPQTREGTVHQFKELVDETSDLGLHTQLVQDFEYENAQNELARAFFSQRQSELETVELFENPGEDDVYRASPKEDHQQESEEFKNILQRANDALKKNDSLLNRFYQKQRDYNAQVQSMPLPMPVSFAASLYASMNEEAVVQPVTTKSLTDWLKHNRSFKEKQERLSSASSLNLIKQLAFILKHHDLNELQNQLTHDIMADCVLNAFIEAYPVPVPNQKNTSLFTHSMNAIKSQASTIIPGLAIDTHVFTAQNFWQVGKKSEQIANLVNILNTLKISKIFDIESFAKCFRLSFHSKKSYEELYHSSYAHQSVEFEQTQLGLTDYIKQELKKSFIHYRESLDLHHELLQCTDDEQERAFVSRMRFDQPDYMNNLIALNQAKMERSLRALTQKIEEFESMNTFADSATLHEYLKQVIQEQFQVDFKVDPAHTQVLYEQVIEDFQFLEFDFAQRVHQTESAIATHNHSSTIELSFEDMAKKAAENAIHDLLESLKNTEHLLMELKSNQDVDRDNLEKSLNNLALSASNAGITVDVASQAYLALKSQPEILTDRLIKLCADVAKDRGLESLSQRFLDRIGVVTEFKETHYLLMSRKQVLGFEKERESGIEGEEDEKIRKPHEHKRSLPGNEPLEDRLIKPNHP